ncbi:MAG: DUF2815 family protein [Oscillospiraceae bacterium]|nr:DUF2815 family protein [Oscillospiraceae bacterium]
MAAVTINDVRFSYVNVFQAKPPFNNSNGEAKFSVTVLVPKTNTQAKALIDQAIAAAIDMGVTTKWNNVRPPQPAICVHDGDGVRPSDGQAFGEECKGCWVFTASAKADHAPFVVDTQVQPIIDPTQVYSGMWGNVSVSFFPYNSAGKKGIGCGLNGLQKIRDGEPLSARVTAQDAFQPVGLAAPATPALGAAMPATSGYGYGAVPAAGQTPWGAPGATGNSYGW